MVKKFLEISAIDYEFCAVFPWTRTRLVAIELGKLYKISDNVYSERVWRGGCCLEVENCFLRIHLFEQQNFFSRGGWPIMN